MNIIKFTGSIQTGDDSISVKDGFIGFHVESSPSKLYRTVVAQIGKVIELPKPGEDGVTVEIFQSTVNAARYEIAKNKTDNFSELEALALLELKNSFPKVKFDPYNIGE